jgi:hypothetical protein
MTVDSGELELRHQEIRKLPQQALRKRLLLQSSCSPIRGRDPVEAAIVRR